MNKCILSVLLFFASLVLHAEPLQSLDLLKSKIEAHVVNELARNAEGRTEVSVGNIDNRLNLRPCADEKLEVFNPYQNASGQGNTMGIRCTEVENHWTIYVPVKITLYKSILMAKHPLIKGATLRDSDIYIAEFDVKKLKQGYFTDSKDLIGQVCKQNITGDTPLTPYNIELAKLIRKGEQITIVAGNNGLVISMAGIALNDGALGETVRVKNISSKRTIEAHVIDRKKVKVIV